MGFFDDGLSVVSGGFSRPSKHRHHKKRRSGSKSRSRSRSSSRHRRGDRDRGLGSHLASGGLLGAAASSFFGNDSHYHKHSSSKASFFGLGGDRNHSRSSFFGFSKPSYYKRSSRHGFLSRSYKQLKRLLRDLAHWAKRHPWKVFFLVLMPLISGGVLTALLARFGLRMPSGLERLMGVASKAVSGDSIGLVGEAVRMAGDSFGGGGAGGSSSASVRINGGRDGAYSYSRESYGRESDGLGDAISGMAKMFF